MDLSPGFNIEDIATPMKEASGEMKEPNFEQLVVKLRKLQQAKRVVEEDICETQEVHDALLEDLKKLQSEAYQLEVTLKDKEETAKVLQFQCEESEQDSDRQLQLNKKNEELLDQYMCQIQELKLKQRKQRMKFEKQLQQLIDQHKDLQSVFTTERLPAEVESAENVRIQLCVAEQVKLSQLHHLEDELEALRKQQQSGETAAE